MQQPDFAALVAQYQTKLPMQTAASSVANYNVILEHLKASDTPDAHIVAAILVAGIFASND